jgi:RNA polymerase sigma-70 factor (ECF subfamily)
LIDVVMVLEVEMTDPLTSLVPALRRYARAMLADPLAADDVVCDFLSAVGRLDWQDVENDQRVEAFTITHLLTVNRLRGRARRAGSTPHESQPKRLDPLSALLSLSEDERAALLLVSIERLSYADTATVLGTSATTVLALLSRARARVAAEMIGESVLVGDSMIR